jgi:hypothetical protein
MWRIMYNQLYYVLMWLVLFIDYFYIHWFSRHVMDPWNVNKWMNGVFSALFPQTEGVKPAELSFLSCVHKKQL